MKGLKSGYDTLVQHLKTIDDGLAKAPVSRVKPLQDRRAGLVKAMADLESRVVSNDESERDRMREDIGTQTEVATTLIADIGQAVERGEKPVPDITYTAPVGVTTQTEITLLTLKAATTSDATLRLVRGNQPTGTVQFARAGGGQKFRLEVDETDAWQAKAETIAVDVGLPTRKITWTPPKEIAWGTRITIESPEGARGRGGGRPGARPARTGSWRSARRSP